MENCRLALGTALDDMCNLNPRLQYLCESVSHRYGGTLYDYVKRLVL